MALVLKKSGSLLTQLYLRNCAPSSLRGLFIRGLPVYTDCHVKSKGNESKDARQEKNVDSQEKNEKKTKEDPVFAASMVVRARSPQPPTPSEGSGGKIH